MSTLKFCRECNNMLYPREDKETRTLLYACQSCEDEEIATDTCVYKRVIRKPVGEPKDVLKDATTDPSLPCTRSVRCYNCNHPEAAFFSGPNFGRASHDTVLHLLQPKLRPQVEGLRRVWILLS